MNKYIWLVVILAVIIVVLLGVLILWPARNNQVQKIEGIHITSPKINEEVSFPIKITGYVDGNGWSGFEGQVGTVQLKQGDVIMAQTFIPATTEWTSLPTYFEATISEASVDCRAGTDCTILGPMDLVFHNENASGLPDRNKEFILPVKIAKSTGEIMTVKAYFINDNLDPAVSCDKVFSVERIIPKTQATARAALEELFNGPTAEEKNNGFRTTINDGVKIQSLTIESGFAKVDFNQQLQEKVGGSCRVTAIRAQITETLKQFSTVKSVVISINGKIEDILQP
jgi:hypothetical protein